MNISKKIITPKIAGELLKLNTSNRRISTSTVEYYTKQMLEGKWIEDTGETIKIGNDGKLIDGQHRLMALIKSDKSLSFYVANDVTTEAFSVIDTGKKRNAADALEINSIPNARLAAGIIRNYILLKVGALQRGTSALSPTNTDILIEYQKNAIYWADTVHKTLSWYSNIGKVVEPSFLGGVYSMLYDIDHDEAKEFMDQLCSGIDIKHKPISLLRNRLINDKLSLKKISYSIKLALVIKTWNYIRKFENITILRYQPDKEEFPIAI